MSDELRSGQPDYSLMRADFDYSAVEESLGEANVSSRDQAMAIAAQGIAEFLTWVVGSQGQNARVSSRTVGLRSIGALWAIRPDLFGGCSLNALSGRIDEAGVTDTILSRYATEFRDTFHFKGRNQRSDESRRRMRLAHRATKVNTATSNPSEVVSAPGESAP